MLSPLPSAHMGYIPMQVCIHSPTGLFGGAGEKHQTNRMSSLPETDGKWMDVLELQSALACKKNTNAKVCLRVELSA